MNDDSQRRDWERKIYKEADEEDKRKMNAMTPTSEQTAEERAKEAIALREHLHWDEDSLEIVLRENKYATMEFHVGSIQDLWNHCISLRLTNQRLEEEVERMKKLMKKVDVLISDHCCGEDEKDIEAFRLLRDLESQRPPTEGGQKGKE